MRFPQRALRRGGFSFEYSRDLRAGRVKGTGGRFTDSDAQEHPVRFSYRYSTADGFGKDTRSSKLDEGNFQDKKHLETYLGRLGFWAFFQHSNGCSKNRSSEFRPSIFDKTALDFCRGAA